MASRSVTSLTIKAQSGVENTYYASWEFKQTSTPSSPSGSIKAGALVSIVSGATYYNGSTIPSWVAADQWYVVQVRGDRAVLGKNASGTNDIQSPINTKYLTTGTTAAAASTSDYESTLDHYEVRWEYDSGDGIWFTNSDWSNTENKYSTYSPPENALNIRVFVKPVSKTYKPDGKTETNYWDGQTSSASFNMSYAAPEKVTGLSVEVDRYRLKASVTGINDPRADQIEFELTRSSTLTTMSRSVTVYLQKATCEWTLILGAKYVVRARAINIDNKNAPGPWSDYSEEVTTVPDKVYNVVCSADSETSVKLTWNAVDVADSYTIEYTQTRDYFGTTSSVSSMTVDNPVAYVTGLETGHEWFFRVRASNEVGDSVWWSDIVSSKIGTKPGAPTTWSSTTTAITGEPLNLYWVHNSEDGSSQTYAELELYIDGVKETYTIKNSEVEEEKDKTSVYSIDTSQYIEGTKIQWAVRTAGVTLQYGDWSVQRTIDVYAPPTLELSMTDSGGNPIDTLLTFPFYISGLAGPNTQEPIGYYLSITANDSYDTTDHMGNPKHVNVGDLVYSANFDTSDALLVELSASSVDLENTINYTVSCIAAMNSGLTAEASLSFKVDWSDVQYYPNAEIGIDTESYSAYIRPFCTDDDEVLIPNVLLSVYRRDFDGGFTEISRDIDNLENTFVTDPHPALDFARYRIVAMDKDTGSISYHDVPGYPVGGKAIIIQWDEDWTNFYTGNNEAEDELATVPWSGSMLKLPYNIDVSDSNSLDAQLIEYIGRKHPVSYYGTQVGETSTWNTVIEKSDTQTIYALRRLARWTGDVYVREPSGTGYWANIAVSFNINHLELTIPVSLSIVRVEGGV